MLCLYDVGNFRSAISVSKFPGNLARMSAATSSTISSVDLPLPEDAFAYNMPVNKTVQHNTIKYKRMDNVNGYDSQK